MPIAISRPSSNGNALWQSNPYTSINEEILQPAVGNGTMIVANKNDDHETQLYGMSNPGVDNITGITAWLYHYTEGGSLRIAVGIGADVLPSQLLPSRSSRTWDSVTFTGQWTQAQFAALAQTHLIAGSINQNEDVRVDTLYWEVTYSIPEPEPEPEPIYTGPRGIVPWWNALERKEPPQMVKETEFERFMRVRQFVRPS